MNWYPFLTNGADGHCRDAELRLMHLRGEIRRPLSLNEISGEIVDASIKAHSALGPGLLEGAYQACVAHEFRKRLLSVSMQVAVPVRYNGVIIRAGYRIDLLVENAVIVELKAISKVHPIQEAQLLSHMKLGDFRLGLLINFHVLRLKDGIIRLANRM
jgi:GxxExxY protein